MNTNSQYILSPCFQGSSRPAIGSKCLGQIIRAWVALSVLLPFSSSATIRYVDLNSASPTPPFTNWVTAATNIQEAVDAAVAGDEILVTNGSYSPIYVTKTITVQSVNGPELTLIDGGGVIACAVLVFNPTLSGFTLTNGNYNEGGGANGGILNNCILIGNHAEHGGGAANAVLNHCKLIGNTAEFEGGGAWAASTLNNCTLIGNSAYTGGGASWSTLNNCVLKENSAHGGGGASACGLNNCTITANIAGIGGGVTGGSANNCIVYYNTNWNGNTDNVWNLGSINFSCTTPMPTTGLGNITNAPLFTDAAAGNFHLQTGSPCIDAGDNDLVTTPTDLEGKERIVGGGVDMGAYEWVAVPTHYVSLNSPQPMAPFLSWSTAATNIQDAVDAAVAGDQILVTNGVYQTGGKAVFGSMTNRVAVDKPVALQGVNGPLLTIIQGYQVPVTTNGNDAIRCVYLTNGASLSGFTLTNGATRTAGDVLHEQEGGGLWCESVAATVSDCTIVGNAAFWGGGGSLRGTFGSCTFRSNSAYRSGAVAGGVLNNCILTCNRAEFAAGAASGGTLTNCTLSGNSANLGGAAFIATLVNCALTNNTATGQDSAGGGAAGGTLINCLLAGNSADRGGGAYALYGTLMNCSMIGNSAVEGGGACYGTLIDCLLTNNSASYRGAGAFTCTLSNCTLTGNFTSGTNGYGGGAHGGWITNCTLTDNWAHYGGGASGSTLESCTMTGNMAEYGGGVYYATAYNCLVATNAAVGGGGGAWSALNHCLLLGNQTGFGWSPSPNSYGAGGAGAFYGNLTNCTLTGNRCHPPHGGSGGGSLGATLANCVLSRNRTDESGGGAYYGALYNCTLTGNQAVDAAGGAAVAQLINCLLVGNSANYGGGAGGCALTNCTLTGNSAGYGGGTSDGHLKNCIIYGNRASYDSRYDEYYGIPDGDHCCSTADVFGPGSFTNAPLFVDEANGNLRLQSNSPCINAGENVFAILLTDLDGRPRGQGGALDIGAYEFQPGVSGAFIGWLAGSGLPTDGSADYSDSDGDWMNNWQEWIAGTNPTNSVSALRMLNPSNDVSGITVSWQSMTNRTYFLERAADLGAASPFSLLSSNIVGQSGTTSFTDTNAVTPGPFFYRVGVQ